MKNFQRGGFGPNKGSFEKRPSFHSSFAGKRGEGFKSNSQKELFPAVCSECKKRCDVPFLPNGKKSVFCIDCFRKQEHVPGRNSNGSDGPLRIPADGGMEGLRKQVASIEGKINRLLEIVSGQAGR